MKIIGMIHLKALPGYDQHESMDAVIEHAVDSAKKLELGGVDSILIENTDDDPHQKTVGPETVAAFTSVALNVRRAVNIPIGICVLWNDYKASLGIAKAVGASFVRVPVFTEAVLTSSGMIEGNPYDVITYRRLIGAKDIKIMADIHVKHSTVLSKRSIGESASEAIHFCADEVIITGKYTGDAPIISDIENVRNCCPNAIIAVGSGTTSENLTRLNNLVDIAIVGTAIKNPDGRINTDKVKQLVDLAKNMPKIKQ